MRQIALAISTITAQVPYRMRLEIDRIAHEEGLTVSENIRALIDYGLRAYRSENRRLRPWSVLTDFIS